MSSIALRRPLLVGLVVIALLGAAACANSEAVTPGPTDVPGPTETAEAPGESPEPISPSPGATATPTSTAPPVLSPTATPFPDIPSDVDGLEPTLTAVPATPQATPDQPQTLEELIASTEDPDWSVRWEAVNELGNRGDPRAIPALVKRALIDDNSHPRWRSLWALSAVDQAGVETVPLLLPALDDEDPIVVRNAAVALAFFNRQEAIPELLHGLGDPDNFRRWEAVFSLKGIDEVDVVDALLPLLDQEAEPDDRVRGEVALTLGRRGGAEIVPDLLKALKDDASASVRSRAAMALAQVGGSTLVEELEQILATEDDSQVAEFLQNTIDKLSEKIETGQE